MEEIIGKLIFQGIYRSQSIETGKVIDFALAPFLDTTILKIDTIHSESIATGLYIGEDNNDPIFQVSKIFFSKQNNFFQKNVTIEALKDTTIYPQKEYVLYRHGFSLAIITLSDKGFLGNRVDESGPLIENIITSNLPISYIIRSIIPDEFYTLKGLISQLIYIDKIDLLITTGGTGVTSRDITADVTSEIIEKRLHGFEMAMILEGLKKTPHAIISRAVCGVVNKSLIINLPGSQKAVSENLQAILPALNHTLQKIKDDPSECGK